MDDKQSRLLTWMAGALAILIAALVFVDPPEGGDDEDEQTWTPIHDEITTNKVVRMTLDSGEGSLTVEKENETWKITAPDPLPADQEAVQAIAREIAGIMCGEAISDTVDPQFGLAPPQLSADVTLDDGTSVQLLVGRDAPVGWSSYAVCGTDGVVRPTKNKLSNLQFSFDQLRSQVVLPAALAPEKVVIENGATTTTLERQTDGWYLDDGRRVATNRVANFIDALARMKPVAFDAPPVQPPKTTVTLTADDGQIVLTEGENGSLRTTEQPTPIAPDVSLRALVPEVPSLVADRLFTVAPTSITISVGGTQHTATLNEDGWDQTWAQPLLEAKVDRTMFSALPPAGDAVTTTIVVSDPLAGEQTVQVVTVAEQLMFRDRAGSIEHPLPDEVGSILLSL